MKCNHTAGRFFSLTAKSVSRRQKMFLAICTLLVAIPRLLHAETLNEVDIRQLYKEQADAIRNPSKTYKLMESRLDDNFALIAKTSRTLGSAPTETGTQKLTKKMLILQTMQGYGMMRINTYEQNIVDVKFSDDHKWGYVSQTTTMHGALAVTLDTGKAASAMYTDAEACIDTLALRGGIIKIVQSQCTIQTTLSTPQ